MVGWLGVDCLSVCLGGFALRLTQKATMNNPVKTMAEVIVISIARLHIETRHW